MPHDNYNNAQIRDFILARVQAAQVRVESASEALKEIASCIVDPAEDEKEEPILELLESIIDDTGLVARGAEAIQAVFEEGSFELFLGEPDYDEITGDGASDEAVDDGEVEDGEEE